MSNKIMKTLTLNGVTYRVRDERVDNKADKPVIEEVTIATNAWSELADNSPYTYSTTVSLTNLTPDSSSIELINNNPVLFAAYGFAIASVEGSNVVVYSVEKPSADVVLTFEVVNSTSEVK